MAYSNVMVLALALWCGLCQTVLAQDERLARQALHCAVLMQLLADEAPPADGQVARWQQASAWMSEVHLRALPDGVSSAHQRAEVLAHWQAARARQEAAVQEDVVVCGAWAEGFLAQGDRFRYVPVYPKVIAPAWRSRYAEVARRWLGMAALSQQ